MKFITVHGTQESAPPLVECCGNVVFVRRDIRRVSIPDPTHKTESIEMWEYEECKCTTQEFTEYFSSKTSHEEDVLRSDIDFIAMESGIDLDQD